MLAADPSKLLGCEEEDSSELPFCTELRLGEGEPAALGAIKGFIPCRDSIFASPANLFGENELDSATIRFLVGECSEALPRLREDEPSC